MLQAGLMLSTRPIILLRNNAMISTIGIQQKENRNQPKNTRARIALQNYATRLDY